MVLDQKPPLQREQVVGSSLKKCYILLKFGILNVLQKKQRKNIQKEVIKNDNNAQKNINNITCPGDEYLPGGKRVCRQRRRFKTGTGLDGRAA